MVAEDSVDRPCPADVQFHVADIDGDVSGAAMAGEDAGGPAGVDRDVGVPHGDVQIAGDALGPDDAAPAAVDVDDDVADDDVLVAAVRVVRVVVVAAVAVDGEGAQPVAGDREGAAGDLRPHRARRPVVGERNPSRVRRHVGGREERDAARTVRAPLDPDGGVEREGLAGKDQLVVIGVVAVVDDRQVVGEPDGEIALAVLAGAVHDVAVRGRVVVRGGADDRRPRFVPAALVLPPRRAGDAERGGQGEERGAGWETRAHAPRETRKTAIADALSNRRSCEVAHETLPDRQDHPLVRAPRARAIVAGARRGVQASGRPVGARRRTAYGRRR